MRKIDSKKRLTPRKPVLPAKRSQVVHHAISTAIGFCAVFVGFHYHTFDTTQDHGTCSQLVLISWNLGFAINRLLRKVRWAQPEPTDAPNLPPSKICLSHKSNAHFSSPYLQSDEEEIVDKFPQLREECKKSCPKQLKLYKDCTERIASSGTGDCEAWYIDLISCADKCVAPKIFALTKGG